VDGCISGWDAVAVYLDTNVIFGRMIFTELDRLAISIVAGARLSAAHDLTCPLVCAAALRAAQAGEVTAGKLRL